MDDGAYLFSYKFGGGNYNKVTRGQARCDPNCHALCPFDVGAIKPARSIVFTSSALTSSPVNLRCERRCCTKSLKSIVLCLWYICCKGSAKRAKYKIKNKFCFHFNGLWGYSSKSHRRASGSTAGSESHNNFGILSLMTSNDGSLYSFFLLVIVVYFLMYFFPFLINAPLLGLPLSERPLRS